MGLNPDALIDVAAARAYLDVKSTDKPSDAFLEGVINGLSTEVHAHTGRLYKPSDDAATVKVFQHRAGDKLLDVADVRDVELVRISTDPSDDTGWQDLDPSEWWAEPLHEDVKRQIRFLNAADYPSVGQGWGALTLHVAGRADDLSPETRSHFFAVEVTGKYGHVDVPEHVALAVKMWLQNIHKRDVAYFSSTFAEGAVALPGPMPEDVKKILDDEREDGATVVAI